MTAYAIVVAGLLYFTCIVPSINARIVVASAFLGYVRMAVSWTACFHRPRHRPAYSYFFVSTVAALGGLVHLSRALAVILGLENHTHFMDPSPLNIAFIATGIVTLPCLAIGAVMLAYDRMAERMEHLAAIDELTGALTRREFMAQAESRLERARRTRSPFAVAILDIDHFKAINDAHGHAAGDLALSYFSSIVSRQIRGATSSAAWAEKNSPSCSPTPARKRPMRWSTGFVCASPNPGWSRIAAKSRAPSAPAWTHTAPTTRWRT